MRKTVGHGTPQASPTIPTWTPNQIVAHNLAKARLLRGWTQDQAAEACAPYLGTRLSAASWSALERSVDGNRIREITADELVAFARAFDLPVGFFLTPPSAWDNHLVATPDHPDGLEPLELFDVVIGTPENLAAWEQYLQSWPSPGHRVRLQPDGTMEALGRVAGRRPPPPRRPRRPARPAAAPRAARRHRRRTRRPPTTHGDPRRASTSRTADDTVTPEATRAGTRRKE